MTSSVPSRRWEIASDRIASSVATPPALRMTCPSPSASPSTFCGSASRPCPPAPRPPGPEGAADLPCRTLARSSPRPSATRQSRSSKPPSSSGRTDYTDGRKSRLPGDRRRRIGRRRPPRRLRRSRTRVRWRAMRTGACSRTGERRAARPGSDAREPDHTDGSHDPAPSRPAPDRGTAGQRGSRRTSPAEPGRPRTSGTWQLAAAPYDLSITTACGPVGKSSSPPRRGRPDRCGVRPGGRLAPAPWTRRSVPCEFRRPCHLDRPGDARVGGFRQVSYNPRPIAGGGT